MILLATQIATVHVVRKLMPMVHCLSAFARSWYNCSKWARNTKSDYLLRRIGRKLGKAVRERFRCLYGVQDNAGQRCNDRRPYKSRVSKFHKPQQAETTPCNGTKHVMSVTRSEIIANGEIRQPGRGVVTANYLQPWPTAQLKNSRRG